MSIERFGDKVGFIWSVADMLRGPYKPAQYGQVMLLLTGSWPSSRLSTNKTKSSTMSGERRPSWMR